MKKTIYICAVLLITVLSMSLLVVLKGKSASDKKWKEAVGNTKAYSNLFNTANNSNRVFKLTIEQLKYTNDSIFKELNKTKKDLKVKDSKLKALQYVTSNFVKTDTIVFTDTIFKGIKINVDTMLNNDWYSVRIKLKYPSTVIVNPEFKSEKHLIVSAKRETVNPPKRFFLFRWLQKKHTVLNVNVVERNPYVQNQNSRFVEVVK